MEVEDVVDDIDRQILIVTGEGIALTSEPFSEVAEKLKIREDEVISRLKRLLDDGIIRRFGALINHRKAGFTANALVVWRVSQDRVEEVGGMLSRFREVTHCYERRTIPGHWDYNLFTVVHGYCRKDVEILIKKLSEAVKVRDYLALFSTKEFKKASLTFISDLKGRDYF